MRRKIMDRKAHTSRPHQALSAGKVGVELRYGRHAGRARGGDGTMAQGVQLKMELTPSQFTNARASLLHFENQGAWLDHDAARRAAELDERHQHDYSDLHELVDRLEPEQAEELREHALRLVRPAGGRFKVLQSFSGPCTDLCARAREILRARAS